jgi:O-antigen/teichoic acid export membrane protein
VIARLLDADQVGTYGIVSVTVMTLLSLKQVGIDEAFVQQDSDDQESAFQHAFTLDLALSAGFALLVIATAPLIGWVYGDWSLTPLMVALSLLPLLFALQAPAWVFLRRMDFVKQRSLQAVVPVVTLTATVALIVAGLGAWALAIGALLGNAAAALFALVVSPYRVSWNWDRAVARKYLTFSFPIFLAAICGLIIRQGQTLAFETKLGLAGAGYLTLAVTLTRYADRADQMITQTIYPAICAITDQPKRMAELFEKSNRLTAMWALPFGAGLALFAEGLVRNVLGTKWLPAVPLIQIIGVSTAIYQLGFNWTAFHRAVGRTRPQTIYAIVGLVTFLAVPLPLLFSRGATAFAWGLFAVNIVAGSMRWAYMRQLLPDARIAGFVGKALVPPLIASAVIVAFRAILHGGTSLTRMIIEVLAFVAVYAAATALSERSLLREAVGYVRASRIPMEASGQ